MYDMLFVKCFTLYIIYYMLKFIYYMLYIIYYMFYCKNTTLCWILVKLQR